MATVQQPPITRDRKHAHGQLTAATWGLLFVWVGVAVWANLSWGFGLLGVGVIILGGELVHEVIGSYRLDWFATIVGLMFLIGGTWELFSIQAGLIPALCIVAGVALVVSALVSRPAH